MKRITTLVMAAIILVTFFIAGCKGGIGGSGISAPSSDIQKQWVAKYVSDHGGIPGSLTYRKIAMVQIDNFDPGNETEWADPDMGVKKIVRTGCISATVQYTDDPVKRKYEAKLDYKYVCWNDIRGGKPVLNHTITEEINPQVRQISY